MFRIDPKLHDFTNAKVGDQVYDILLGQGWITEIEIDTAFPLLVYFYDSCNSFQEGKRYTFVGDSVFGCSIRLYKEPMQVMPATGKYIHVISCRACPYITKHGNLPDDCTLYNLRIENYDVIHPGCKL